MQIPDIGRALKFYTVNMDIEHTHGSESIAGIDAGTYQLGVEPGKESGPGAGSDDWRADTATLKTTCGYHPHNTRALRSDIQLGAALNVDTTN